MILHGKLKWENPLIRGSYPKLSFLLSAGCSGSLQGEPGSGEASVDEARPALDRSQSVPDDGDEVVETWDGEIGGGPRLSVDQTPSRALRLRAYGGSR